MKKRRIMIIVVVVIVVLFVVLAILYQKDLKSAKERFLVYKEKANQIKTSFGKMSYIDEGDGEVILSCHGICGGYDQAYDTLADKTDMYRVLAPSRFGYSGTDMPEDATIEMQATAYRELLDYLGIDKAYVLSTSAGAASAIKFALMYPERTKGLILYCSGYPGWEKPEKKLAIAGPPAAICSNLAMWIISPLFEPIMGMDRSTIHEIMPMDDKKDGIVFDGKVTNTVMVNDFEEYDLSKLNMPVLIMHAKDDKLADFENAEHWAKKINKCKYLFFDTGGHLMTGNSEAINEALSEFVS